MIRVEKRGKIVRDKILKTLLRYIYRAGVMSMRPNQIIQQVNY